MFVKNVGNLSEDDYVNKIVFQGRLLRMTGGHRYHVRTISKTSVAYIKLLKS